MRSSLTLSRLTLLLLNSCTLQVAHAQATAPSAPATEPVKHFDPLGQPPSKFTIELRNGIKAQLPFSDKRDFDEAKRGFIAEPP
jgi:alkyl sulfatase BDS1-like metallo-beta-lactamase superfamily hydrolase